MMKYQLWIKFAIFFAAYLKGDFTFYFLRKLNNEES